MHFSRPQAPHPESIQDPGPPSSPKHPPLPLAASSLTLASLPRDMAGMVSYLWGALGKAGGGASGLPRVCRW